MDYQKHAKLQHSLIKNEYDTDPEVVPQVRPGHQPPPNYLSQSQIDSLEQRKINDHRFLAAVATRHVQMQIREGEKLRGSSKKSYHSKETSAKKGDDKKRERTGVQPAPRPDPHSYGPASQVDQKREEANPTVKHQQSFYIDSKSFPNSRPVDLSTFRAQNSSMMDLSGQENSGKQLAEQSQKVHLFSNQQQAASDPAADQYALEQILNQYANKFQNMAKMNQENNQNMANQYSTGKNELDLQDPANKMSRSKLHEVAQTNLQSQSAMHSTEQLRPHDSSSVDNYPLLTNAGQFEFPAHLFTSFETSMQQSMLPTPGLPMAGGPSFHGTHPLMPENQGTQYRNPLQAHETHAPSSTQEDGGQPLHSARFNEGPVTIGDAEQKPQRNDSLSQDYMVYPQTDKSPKCFIEQSKKNPEMLTFEGQERGDETLRKEEIHQRVRDLENVLTFSYQSMKSEDRQQLTYDDGNKARQLNQQRDGEGRQSAQFIGPLKMNDDCNLTIVRQSQDYSIMHAGKQFSENIVDNHTTPKDKFDKIRLSDPVTKTVTQNDDRSMKTVSQYNVQHRGFGPIGAEYRADGSGADLGRNDDERSSLYRANNQRRKEYLRRTISNENSHMNNLQSIKLHAIRSKSSLIRGTSSRQDTSPGPDLDQYQLQSRKYHDQEMQVDMMSLSQRTKEENIDLASSREGQDFRMVIHSQVKHSKSQTALLIQELLEGASLSPDEKIALIKQLQLDNNQIDKFLELLALKRQQFQNMEHLEELKLQNVSQMSINQRISILNKQIRQAFPSPNQIVLLILHSQDEQPFTMKRSKSQGRVPKDAVLYFLTFDDLMQLKKVQSDTQTRLDNESRIKLTGAQASVHANNIFDKCGMRGNSRPKQSRVLQSTVSWKIKVESYQSSLLERFFSSLIQKGYALRLIRHTAARLNPEQQLYPNTILPLSFSACYYAPIGQRHFKVKERQMGGDDLNAFWGKQKQQQQPSHETDHQGDFIKEMDTNLAENSGAEVNTVETILKEILFEMFTVNAVDLVGIKGISRTNNLVKKVQHFWSQHNGQAKSILKELQHQKKALGKGAKQVKHAGIKQQKVPVQQTSSSSLQRVRKIDMTSPSNLQFSNQASTRLRRDQDTSYMGVEYRRSESPDYFTNSIGMLAGDPNRHQRSFKDTRKGTLYNTASEIDSQVPASALLPKVLQPQQLISGTSREIMKEGSLGDEGQSKEGSMEKEVGRGRKMFKVNLTNTDLSPQIKTDSFETANRANLNQDLLDPFAVSKESRASKMDQKKKESTVIYPSQTNQERSNERTSDSMDGRKRQLNYTSQKSHESQNAINYQQQSSNVINFAKMEQLAPIQTKLKQNVATGQGVTNSNIPANAGKNHSLQQANSAQILLNSSSNSKYRNHTTSQNTKKMKIGAGETQKWANQPLLDKKINGVMRYNSTTPGIEWLKKEVKRSQKNLTQQLLIQDEPEDLISRHLSQTNFHIGGITDQMNDSLDQNSTINIRLRGYNLSNLKKSNEKRPAIKKAKQTNYSDFKVFTTRRSTQQPSKPQITIQQTKIPYNASAYALPPMIPAQKPNTSSLSQPQTTTATPTPVPDRPLFIVSTNQRSAGCSIDKVDSFATHALMRARSNGNLENRKGCVARVKDERMARKGKRSLQERERRQKRRDDGAMREKQATQKAESVTEEERMEEEEKRSLQEMNELDQKISTSDVNALDQDAQNPQKVAMAVNVSVKMPGAKPDGPRKETQHGHSSSGVNYFTVDFKKQGSTYVNNTAKIMDYVQSLRVSEDRNMQKSQSRVVYHGKMLPDNFSNNQNEYDDSPKEYGGSALDILSSAHQDFRNNKTANVTSAHDEDQASRRATYQSNFYHQPSTEQQKQQPLLVKQYELNSIDKGSLPGGSGLSNSQAMARTEGFNMTEERQQENQIFHLSHTKMPLRGATAAAGAKRRKSDEKLLELGKVQQSNQIARTGSGLVKGLALVGSKSSKLIHNLKLKQDLTRHREYNLLIGAYGQQSDHQHPQDDKKPPINKFSASFQANDSRHKLNSESVTVLGTRQVSQHTSNHDEHLQNMENATASEYALILLNKSESKAKNVAHAPHEQDTGQSYSLLQEISIDNQNDLRARGIAAVSPNLTKDTLHMHQQVKPFDSIAADSPLDRKTNDQNSTISMAKLQQHTIASLNRSDELIGDELVRVIDKKQDRSGARNNSRDQGRVELQRIVTKIGKTRVIKQKNDAPSQSNSTLMHETRRTQGLLGSAGLNKSGSDLRKVNALGSSADKRKDTIESKKGTFNVKTKFPFDDGGHGEVSLDKSLFSPDKVLHQDAQMSANSRNQATHLPESNLLTPNKRATSTFRGDEDVSHSFKNERIRNEVRVTTSGIRKRQDEKKMFTSDTQTAKFHEVQEIMRQTTEMRSDPSKNGNSLVFDDVQRQHSKGIEKQTKKSVYSSRKDTNYNSRGHSQEDNRFTSNMKKVKQINQDLMGHEPYISMGESAANHIQGAEVQTVQHSEPHGMSPSRQSQSEDVLELITKSILEQEPHDNNAKPRRVDGELEDDKEAAIDKSVDQANQEENKEVNVHEGSRLQSVAVSTSKTKTPVNQQTDPNITVSISQEMESLARNYSLVIVAKSPLPRPIKSKPIINYSPVQKRNTAVSKQVGTTNKQDDLNAEDHEQPSVTQFTQQEEVQSQNLKNQSSQELAFEDQTATHQSKTRVIKSQIGLQQQSNRKQEEAQRDNENKNIPLVFIKSPKKQLEETIIASGNHDLVERPLAVDQDLAEASLNQRQDPGSLTLTQRVINNSIQQQSGDNEQLGDHKIDQDMYLLMNFQKESAFSGEDDSKIKIKGQEIVLEYKNNLAPQQKEAKNTVSPTPQSSEPQSVVQKESYQQELALIKAYNQKHQQQQKLKPYQEQMLHRNMSMLTRKRNLVSKKKGAPRVNSRKNEEMHPLLSGLEYSTRQQLLRVASAGLEREILEPTKHGGEELLAGDANTSQGDQMEATAPSQKSGLTTLKNKAIIETKSNARTPGVVSTTHSNDVVLNFNQNFMLPITITEKKSEERASEQETAFDNKKQSVSSQALPGSREAGKLFGNKRFSNQVKTKQNNPYQRPVSSIDELISQQMNELDQSKRGRLKALKEFPMAVLDQNIDSASGSNAASLKQLKLKSKSAAKHVNQLQRQQSNNTTNLMKMSQSTFGNWKNSEGKREKSNESNEGESRLKTAPGLTQSFASNIMKASQVSNNNYGSTTQMSKNPNQMAASQFYVSTGFHDSSSNQQKFVLTSSKIRPLERITKTSHQANRYGMNKKKTVGVENILQTDSDAPKLLQTENGINHLNISERVTTHNLQLASLLPSTIHPGTYSSHVYASTIEQSKPNQQTITNKNDDSDTFYKRSSQKKQKQEHQRPYDNIYQTTTYRSGEGGKSQDLKIIGTTASLATISDHGITKANKFRTNSVGEKVRLPAVQTTSTKQVSQVGTFRDIYSSGIKTQMISNKASQS